MNLRDYQLEAERLTLSGWEDSQTQLGVMPTGCGKTIVFASIIKKRLPKRAIIVAHRAELIWQAKDKIQRVTGAQVDVEMGDNRANIQEPSFFNTRPAIVVATIQTLTAGGDGGGRIGKFDPMEFETLIVDEAHHATSPSYRKVIDYFTTNPNMRVLGVTATPDRADEEALGQVFGQVAFDFEMQDMIDSGWLVGVNQDLVSIENLDFSSIRTTAGDFNGSDLAAVMEQEKNLHGVAGATIDIVGDRRGIGFAASVEQARILSEIFNRHKSGMSAFVCGGTDETERKQIVSDFAAGKIQFLWNCGVFTEGFDDSGVEVISMARPTKSRNLYAQMAGRATRPHESIVSRLNSILVPVLRKCLIKRSCKPHCQIIDFVGNSGKHKLMSVADVLGGNYSDEAVELAKEKALSARKNVNIGELLKESEDEIEEREKRRLEAEARKARLVAKVSYSRQPINPFDVLRIKPAKPRGWDTDKTLSEKQRGVLKKAGINPDSLPYVQGKQLVTEIISRWSENKCTFKQASILKKFDCPTDITFEQAHAVIDQIAAAGWKKPANLNLPEAKTGTAVPDPKPAPEHAFTLTPDDELPF